MFEDMSTLGGDWDNQTMDESQVTKGDGGGSVATGDMDEDDIEADQQRYLKENEMIVEGLRCPDEYLNHLTPMEFEEIVNMFLKFDADGSGTIDKHEVKKILTFLGMEASIKMAQELIDVIDVDQSGEIDFQEFCGFIVLLKKGDPRLGGFGSMLNMLNSTPLGELEKQCATRGLRISFQVVEKRESTLTHPTCWIVQVILVGNFHSIVEGEVVATMGTRKYQGLGPTTKEAKYNAASNAIINLGESMPGVRCKPGEFPEEWLQWLDENLLRGVDPGKAVGILASKGFYPHRNTFLMHRVLVWAALDRFQARFPDIELCDPDTPLHEEFFEWCKACAKKGYDGTVIVKLLEDRGIDLRSHYNHFAQQLENNELGCLMDKNGAEANILDFWYAAKMGYLEDVLIFCKCNVQLNEERVDRHTSERMTALVYAAQYGHSECIKVMLQYGADPRTVDLRGRTPVHHAAMKGHTAACSFLIDGGGMMFSGDIQGNTPLHLAALNNHFETVNYLAFKGLELTRLMTSDKVKVKASHTFDQLCEEVFALMPTKKLTTADTVRLEKVWLCDCANYFISRMDMSVRHMLAPCCPEIQADVLARFDHRPESGVFLTGVNGEPELIKTIANPGDLSLLLKYVFRQTALDNINTWKRTPLHLACDANHINSHEKLILRMIDFHGCNTSMKDMHGRRPIDLLIKDKFMQNMPSATQVREELIIDRRETLIDGMFRQFKQQDLIHTIAQRKAIVDECVGEVRKMTLRLWHCYREGSIARAAFGQGWEMYEDPDTNNFFYCKKPAKPMMGETYSDYGWSEPPRAKALIDRTCALTYLTRVRSTLLRTFEQWQQYREKRTQIDFFYHVLTRDITFVTPKHLGWRYILKERTPERAMRKLGYGNEWEEFQDKYSNTFYRNTITRVCEYDRPADAVSVTPADMLCSAYQYNGKATMQEVYSCEQCNRAWKQSPEGTSSVRICGACVARCHVGHKGVRLVRYALALCMCTDVCRVTQCQCRAMQISQAQIDVQVGAMAAREELARHRKRNQEEPPVFAMVPRYDRDGELKGESGWLICR
ncbi:hypothetical protein B484DRAFT_49632 [Ochromonadaceae sp. CCMP2298]|nr:hypothetical protein B484DRAFT_49632 [Ochromonadaceae sp. CCMP2298]